MRELRNVQIPEDEFLKERMEVLKQWETGKEVDLQEAIEYHKRQPASKNMVLKLREAKEKGEIYATTGMGRATLEEQLELYRYVEEEGCAEILGLSVDSLTRQNDYEEAGRKLEESKRKGISLLNGLPVVNLGVKAIRILNEQTKSPIRPRYGAADPRLCDEILLAGGCSGTSPDVFMDFYHHHAKVSFEEVVRTHQYVARLMAYYEQNGVPMMGSAQGLYGAGICPSLQIAHQLISLLVQATQGVKHLCAMSVGHGNLVQDVASARAREELISEYFEKFGFNDVEIFLNASFNLMEYPSHLGINLGVVFMNTLLAKLIGAVLNDIRTVSEAKAIPSKEDIAFTFKSAWAMQNFLKIQKLNVPEEEVRVECEWIKRETRCILEKVLEMGNGDVVVGANIALKEGVLDHPFAANKAVKAKVVCVKDAEGALRYLETGGLPFTKEIISYHREKIRDRKGRMKKEINYDVVIEDLLAVSKGYII